MSISLQSLLTPSKTVEVDFPDKPGFKVKLAFLSREELVKLRKSCVTTKFNKRTRQPEEELNEELFLKNYVNSVVKGWVGLKYSYLNTLMLVDLTGVKNIDEELEFNEDNALVMMRNSSEFDTFVTEVVGDLGNFSAYSLTNSNKG